MTEVAKVGGGRQASIGNQTATMTGDDVRVKLMSEQGNGVLSRKLRMNLLASTKEERHK